MKIGIFNPSYATLFTRPVFADEEMSHLTTSTFVNSGYSGYILKPIRHDCCDLLRWIEWGHLSQAQFLVGTMTSSFIDASLNFLFNLNASISQKNNSLESVALGKKIFSEEVYCINDKKVTINPKVFDCVRKISDIVGIVNIDFHENIRS